MNLIVDIGNTLVKLAVFENGEMLRQCVAERLECKDLEALTRGERIDRAIVESTASCEKTVRVRSIIEDYVGEVMEFTPSTPVPIGNAYRSPETLGRDRLAAAVGAVTMHPGQNILVVDFGTAVTIDLITADGVFRGGCISPGVRMRFRALHDYTARLPLCDPSMGEGEVGGTTVEALELGVMNSVAFEIEGYIERLRREFDELCVIFTGGDAKFFVKRIKNTIFAECNLVFTGLDRILEYNVREENLD